jgi:hypothetical protein
MAAAERGGVSTNSRRESMVVEDALRTQYVLVEHGLEALDTNIQALHLFLSETECRDKMFKAHTRTVSHAHVYTRMHTDRYTHIEKRHTKVSDHMHTHTYTHTHTHTYTNTHTHT